MAGLHCPGALHPATYLCSLGVMALVLFWSSRCCDRTPKRAFLSLFFCGGGGGKRAPSRPFTFIDKRKARPPPNYLLQLRVIRVAPLLTCGNQGSSLADGVPPTSRRRSASSFHGLVTYSGSDYSQFGPLCF